MRKISIDAVTLRYFPGVGNRWLRMFLSLPVFLFYSYILSPFQNMARDKLNALTVVLLFIIFILSDSSYLSYDVSRAIGLPHAEYEGLLDQYEGRRGLGTPHIVVVSDGGSKRFKLLTIRGSGSLELLEKQAGKIIQLEYIEAKGLITRWSLPVSIRLSTGEVIYDYRDHLDWFENPVLPIDKFLILAFKAVAIFALLFFPLNYTYRLLGQEVQYELNKQGGTKPDNRTKS